MIQLDSKAGPGSFEESRRPWFLPLLLLVFPIIPLFFTYRVRLRDSQLTFGYSTRLTSTTVTLDQVETHRVLDSVRPLRDWGGWGIRYNTNKQLGYIVGSGPAIELTTTSGTYVFNVTNANDLDVLLP